MKIIMNKIPNICVISILALTSFSAFSQDSDIPINSQKELYAALQSSGLNPASQDWVAINNACMSAIDKPAKNKCKLKMALLNTKYKADTDYCNKLVKGKFPDSLTEDHMVKVAQTNPDGTKTFVEVSENGISKTELDNKRIGERYSCLIDQGWNSPTDWKFGKNR